MAKIDSPNIGYYHLEDYLFRVVSQRFGADRALSACDFFCIVIWKANRAKSKVAARLLQHGKGHPNLQSAVDALLRQVVAASDKRARLSVLMESWGFRLPMASAILTVLYPADFTVYDVRVCNVIGDFSDAQHKINFGRAWERYAAYLECVQQNAPAELSLRDKDRYLWGKSFATQLRKDIEAGFSRGDRDIEVDE